MSAILDGRDSIVVLPTGGGKSLCFQAPALVRPGLALVVSPLISLMKDQVDTLVGNGVAAAYLNSSQSFDARAAVTSGVREGRYRLLYVSPERVAGEGSEAFASLLAQAGLGFIAVDEAHCISQWGHDFRPEYRQLARLRQAFPGVGMHAYTATATQRVQARHRRAARLVVANRAGRVVRSRQPRLPGASPARTSSGRLTDVLERHRGQAGIVYCTSRREVDALAAWLTETGVRARPYHAGMDDRARSANQDAFLDEHADVIVATVAFGMGIDRSDVRFVVHAGAPQSLEHYQQESGRAGRDGLEADCVLIYSAADFMKWRLMLERNGELTDARRGLLRDMERYAASVGCRHRHLVGYFGESYPRDGLRRVRLLPRRAGGHPRAGGAREEDPLVRRARRPAFRRGPCDQRPARQHERAGDGAPARQPDHVRPAQGLHRSRGSRLHRAAPRATACCGRQTTRFRCWR